jgi:predicted Zn-dependent protease
MKRQLNLKAALILLLVLLALGVGGHFLHGYQVQRNAASLLAQSEREQEAGNLVNARNYLEVYLGFRPKDMKALERYGLLVSESPLMVDQQNAFFTLEKVIQNNPDRDDLRLKVVPIALQIGRPSDAIAHLAILQKAPKVDARVFELLGDAQERSRRFTEAVTAYDAAIEPLNEHLKKKGSDPEVAKRRVNCYFRKAILQHTRLDKPAKADEAIEDMFKGYFKDLKAPKAHAEFIEDISKTKKPPQDETKEQKEAREAKEPREAVEKLFKANKDSAWALLALVRYQTAFASGVALKKARVALETLIDLEAPLDNDKAATKDPDVLLLAAEMEAGENDLPAARATLNRGLERYPNDERFSQALVRIDFATDQQKEGLQILRKSLTTLSNKPLDLATTADLFLDAGEPDDAKKAIDRISRDEQTAGLKDYLEARLLIASQEWLPALDLLKKSYDGLVRVPEFAKKAHLLAGECHRRLGNPEEELAAARAALEIDPTWLPARMLRAAAVLELGHIEEAAQLYSGLADRSLEARLSAARLWLKWNQSLPPERRHWDEVDGLLWLDTKLDKIPLPALAANPKYLVLRAYALAFEGKLAIAREEAEAACDKSPTEPTLWVAQADVETLDGHPERVPGILTKAGRAAGDLAAIRLAWLNYLAAPAKKKERQELLARFEKTEDQLPAKERAKWLSELAEFHMRRGEREAADRVLTRLTQLKGNENDVLVRGRLLDVLLTQPDAARLKAMAEDLQKLEGPRGTLWRVAEAGRLLTEAARLQADHNEAATKPLRKQARTLLTELHRDRPGWTVPLLLLASLEEREGNSQEAMRQYKRAVDLGARQPDLVLRLGELYCQNNRIDEFLALQRDMQHAGRGAELGRLAAEVSLRVPQASDQALERALQAVPPEGSRDYQQQRWLASMLWLVARASEKGSDKGEKEIFDKVEKEIRAAIKLAPNRPEARVMLVEFLAQRNRREEAKQAAAEAATKIEGEGAGLAIAACWEAADERPRAAAEYEKLLAKSPEDPAVLQAVAMFQLRGSDAKAAKESLRKILALETTTPRADSARRTLALTLAAEGTYQGSSEALALFKERTLSSADQRVMALIQARRPGDRREALRNLEASFLQIPPTQEERFLLAYLYAANHDAAHAREQFVRLLSENPTNPNATYLAVFIQFLIQQKELDSAAHWLEALEKIQPADIKTLALKSRLLHAQKKDDEAVAVLRDFAKGSKEKGSKEDALRQLNVGRILDQMGFCQEAGPYLRAYASMRSAEEPISLFPLIGHLARQDQLEKALDLCEQLRGKVPLDSLVQLWFTCLRSTTRKDEEQWQRVEGWVEVARRKDPKQVVVSLALANLRDLQGKDDEAEKIYREVLFQDPNNLVALNNLAALLAFKETAGQEALDLINRAIDRAGPQPKLLDTRAIAYMALGQGEKAVHDLEQAEDSDPSPASLLRLARAHMMANNHSAALAALRKARAGDVKLSDFHPLEQPVYQKVLRELEKDLPAKAG